MKPSILNVLLNIPLFVDVDEGGDGESGGLEELARALGVQHDPEIAQEELAEMLADFIERAVTSLPESKTEENA